MTVDDNKTLNIFSGDRQMPEEGVGGGGKVWRDLAEGPQCFKHEPEGLLKFLLSQFIDNIVAGEIRGRSQEGNKEVAEVARPDQDMVGERRDQRQVHADGQQEADRNGEKWL